MINEEYFLMADRIKEIQKNISKVLLSFADKMEKFQQALELAADYTRYMEPLVKAFRAISSPYSVLSYARYKELLDNYHWTLPYDIDAKDLSELLSKVQSEKEFDDYMLEYFSKHKVEGLFLYLEKNIPRKHKTLLKQIKKGYDDKLYALINLAMVSIIDDLIAPLLVNEGRTTNYGIMRPVVEDLEQLPLSYLDITCFELLMLSNNIDFIFENMDFSEGYGVNTNKKVRRHSSVHGRKISNKKADSLMLLNTIHTILSVDKLLAVFKRTIIKENKNKVYIVAPNKKGLVRRRMKKLLGEIELD